eukprot:5152039-Pyramimonas_sp.AAC.1
MFLTCNVDVVQLLRQGGEARTDGRTGQGAGGLLKRASCMNREESSSDSAIPKSIVRGPPRERDS